MNNERQRKKVEVKSGGAVEDASVESDQATEDKVSKSKSKEKSGGKK